MESYLLFVYASFADRDSQLALLSQAISPIVSSKMFKFNYGNDSAVFNFKTELIFDELKDYISATVSPYCEQYYLINYSEKLSVNMTKDLYDHLFNLDTETKVDLDFRVGHTKKGIAGNYEDMLNDIGPIFGAVIRIPENPVDNEINEPEDEPTIDQILDKINKYGYENLTENEKQILKKHSKK